MADTIQLRRDTAANWVTANPVLHDGEIGIETDTRKRKCGNGTTAWNSLSYMYSDDLDAEPTANSHKPVESGGTKAAIDIAAEIGLAALDAIGDADNVPTEESTELVRSGGVWEAIRNNGKGAFDISAYKAVGGVLAKFDDLAQALGTNGANVPSAARKPGMSVCFVLNSDNKYVQWRLMSDSFNTTPADWQGVDDEPTNGSNNLVKSGGVFESYNNVDDILLTWIEGYYLNRLGYLQANSNSSYTEKTEIASDAKNLTINLEETSTSGRYTVLYADDTVLQAWSQGDISDAGGTVNVDLSVYRLQYPNSTFYIALSKVTANHLTASISYNKFDKLSQESVKIVNQSLTDAQKQQARENIGAVSEVEVQDEINDALKENITLDLVFINGAFYNGDHQLVENSGSKYTENTLVPSEYHTLHIEVTPTNESARMTFIMHGPSPELGSDIVGYSEESLSDGGINIDVDNLRNQYSGDNIYIAVSILNSSTFSTNNVTIDKYATQEQLNVVNEKVDALKNSDIECWGDSLTAAGLYEAAMVEEIPDTFSVLNCGVSGENIYDICARAGAMPIFTKNAITLVPNTEVQIGNINDSGLYTYDTLGNIVALNPRRQAVSDDKFNPLYINGIACQLYWRANGPADPNGLYKLWGVGITGNVTIPANTICYPFGVKNLKKPHCSILWMGTNGGYDITSTQGIYDTMVKAINQFKEANNPEVLLVVGLHLADTTYRANLEKIMATEYGPFYFNLRKYLVEFGCADAGVTPTSADEAAMAAGNCPPSLLKDGTHFTDAGYAAIGRKIAQILNELGVV